MGIIEQIKDFKPKYEFFIGVDSDGCAFNTMDIKHKKAFIPLAIEIWGLENIKQEFIEVAEFINLYSISRGINRFAGLLRTFEYLKERSDVRKKVNDFPNYTELKEFVDKSEVLSNSSLKKFIGQDKYPFLEKVFMWSEQSDQLIAKKTKDNPPYGYVKESLEKISRYADAMIVSAASTDALYQEWGQCDLLKYMTLVAGQDVGSKANQIRYATDGKYDKKHILLLGDAPGDLKSAKENGVLFYPINPGREEESWQKFYEEALDKFISGQYDGAYEKKNIDEFLSILASDKPWA